MHLSLMVPVLFLHGLILMPSHWVPPVIDADSPRCQALTGAPAYPLRIKLNVLTAGQQVFLYRIPLKIKHTAQSSPTCLAT